MGMASDFKKMCMAKLKNRVERNTPTDVIIMNNVNRQGIRVSREDYTLY